MSDRTYAYVHLRLTMLAPLRFGEEAVQRMVDFIEDAREEGLFSSDPRVLDVGAWSEKKEGWAVNLPD